MPPWARTGSRAATTSRTGTEPPRGTWAGGFTLIELALVAVVLGLLLLAAAPRLHQTALRMRLEQTAAELVQLLRAAHEQAIAGGQETVWVWEATARRARVERSGDPPAAPGALEVLASSRLPEGLSVSLTRDGEAVGCGCVRFFPDGTSEPTALTLRLRGQTVSATVDDATGQVRLSPGAFAR